MYHFIINPHSRTGKARQLWEELRQELELKQIEYKEYFTERAGHATEITSDICTSIPGIKNIVIVGGDGTANEVINGIDSYENILLGYIPTGSSNDLARGMEIPNDPKEALEHILNPTRFRLVDHGIIENLDSNTSHKFAVSCGIGYDAAVCYEALRSKAKKILNKIGLGKLTYFAIAVKQILYTKPIDAELIVDGTTHISAPKMVFGTSMIHKYEGGGLPMVPSAKPDDRKLSVCIVSNIPRLKIFFLMPSIFFGKHVHIKGIQIFDCTTLEIHTKEKMIVHTDGEFGGFHSHVRLSCTPEQIRMIS